MTVRAPGGSARRAPTATPRPRPRGRRPSMRRAGSPCSSASAGASTGSRSAASQPWSAAGADARCMTQHLDEHQLGQAGRHEARARVRRHALGGSVGDARLHPSACRRPRAAAPRTPTGRRAARDRRAGRRTRGSRTPDRRAHLRRRGGWPGDRSHGSGSSSSLIGTHAPATRHRSCGGRRRAGRSRRRLSAQWRSPSSAVTQHVRERRCGTEITRSAPGCSSVGQRRRPRLERERLGELGAEEDRALQAELLERGMQHGGGSGPSRCRVAHGHTFGVSAITCGVSVMDLSDFFARILEYAPHRISGEPVGSPNSGRGHAHDRASPSHHVALTVRDLSVSVPWYEALFDAEPVIDEDTDPDMHHTVYLVANGTLFGLHQHGTPAPAEHSASSASGSTTSPSAAPTAPSSRSGQPASTSSASPTAASRTPTTARA